MAVTQRTEALTPSRGNSEMENLDTEVALGDAGAGESEKMLSVSRVNEIVKKEKAHAAEKAVRELEARHKAELERLSGQGSQNMGGMDQLSPEQLSKIIDDRVMQIARQHDEEFTRKEQEESLKDVARKFAIKMQGGKDAIPDFDEVMQGFNPADFPGLVFMSSELENTPAVMYELSKNPMKLAALDTLYRSSPSLAKREMEKLSKSIVENQAAKDAVDKVNEPLSKMKSSNVGADSGNMDVKSLRKQPWLRG
jgi:hypothetical protein